MPEKGLDTRYNLIDNLKLVKDNKVLPFIETCTEELPFIKDISIVPANGILSHEGSREVSIPTPQIVKIGAGHDASVSKWDNFKEDISRFVDRLVVPKSVLDIQPNKQDWLRKRESRHAHGFLQGVVNHFFYGTSAANPEKFDGLDVRYKTPDNSSGSYDPTNPDPATAADFAVFDAAGTGSATTSLWLIQPNVDKICGITPINNPQMGLDIDPQPLTYGTDENSKQRLEYRTEFEWYVGLCISTIRSVARIRNIDARMSQINASIIRLIYQARNEIFEGNEAIFMYCHPRMMTHFQVMAEAKQNVLYDRNNVYDVPMYRFGDMPLRPMKAVKIDETAVTAV